VTEPLLIRVVPRARRAEALRFALADLPREEAKAVGEELLAGEASGRGKILVVEAAEGGKCSGALAAWLLPGNSATVWPPYLQGANRQAVLAALGQALARELQAGGARHAQAMLPVDAAASADALAACGFDWVADLRYLVCNQRHFPQLPPQMPFHVRPHADEGLDLLSSLVEATYEGTLDCPALNGLRSTRDVLLGYRATGEFRSDWWFFAEYAGRLIGCLILADYPAATQVELVYFGLVPEARGAGYGEWLIRWAQYVAREAGRERIVLAVDARNQPASDTYLRCGFEEWGRRAVWLRLLPSPGKIGE
jgi:ribosomal protein S18 acetylase RimI-like enzyme